MIGQYEHSPSTLIAWFSQQRVVRPSSEIRKFEGLSKSVQQKSPSLGSAPSGTVVWPLGQLSCAVASISHVYVCNELYGLPISSVTCSKVKYFLHMNCLPSAMKYFSRSLSHTPSLVVPTLHRVLHDRRVSLRVTV